MSLEAVRKEAADGLGELTERNARIEIRVDSAKDVFVPKVARLVKGIQESVRPLPSIIHKSLSSDLKFFLDDFEAINIADTSKLMNLGGITIKNSSMIAGAGNIAVFFGLDVDNGKLMMYVEVNKRLDYPANLPVQDMNIFSICRIVKERAIPVMSLKNSKTAEEYAYTMVVPYKREVHVLESRFYWPLVSGDMFFDYINNAWEFVKDPLFELCRS